MKKIILFMTSLLLLSSCTNQPLKDEEKDKPYILFATPLSDHMIWLQAKDGLDDACEAYQVHCDWIGPNVIDTNKMNDVIETGILQQADGIITQGVIDDELIKAASDNGIPLILVDSDQPESGRYAYMGKDFKQQAQLLLEDIESNYGKDKKLIIAIQVAEGEFGIAQDQIKEVKEVFQKHKGGYELVSISESKSDVVRAKREWMNVMSEHDNVNVAINFAAESAVPCSETIIEKGLRKNVLIYGVDDMPTTIDLIKRGDIDGSIVTSFYDYGYQGVKMIMDYIQSGKKQDVSVLSPNLVIVNESNVNTYKGKLYEAEK
ncbi:substrate-binding domain-containing protein [[Eubacterium] hominis]|uniref:substrate-binding domain-containing protein n=1 Tax=[Eubacterium] hominis TaxID=2764325 RepID=UPI003A4D690D